MLSDRKHIKSDKHWTKDPKQKPSKMQNKIILIGFYIMPRSIVLTKIPGLAGNQTFLYRLGILVDSAFASKQSAVKLSGHLDLFPNRFP